MGKKSWKKHEKAILACEHEKKNKEHNMVECVNTNSGSLSKSQTKRPENTVQHLVGSAQHVHDNTNLRWSSETQIEDCCKRNPKSNGEECMKHSEIVIVETESLHSKDQCLQFP